MSDSTRTRRGPFARGTDTGHRAKFSELLPYLFEHKKVLAVVLVLSVLGAAASLAQPLLVSQVIGLVESKSPIGGLVWALVGLVVVAGVVSGYEHYLLQRTGESVVLGSRRRLVARMLNLPISEFDRRRTGDLVSRVGSDTTLLRAVLTQGLVEAIGGSLTFLGALIAMLIIDPVLLALTVLVIAASVVTVTLLSGRIRVASQKAQDRVGDLAAAVERAISSVRTIRAANATQREIDAVDEHAGAAWQMGVKVAKISALVVPVAAIAMQVSFLVVLGVGGFRVASGAISIANLVAFIIFLFMLIMPLGQAFGAVTSVNAALGALGRIQEIIRLPSESEHDHDIAPLAITVGAANEAVNPDAPAVAFEHVTFAYPDDAIAPDAREDALDPVAREDAGGRVPGKSEGSPENGAAADPTEEHASSVGSLAFEAATGRDVIAEAEAAVADATEGPATLGGQASHGTAAGDQATGGQASGDPASGSTDRGRQDAPSAPRERGVLHGVSFTAPRGKRTALVGPSGAGKSTILALIERFYDPTAGTVRLGGLDIRTLERDALRGQIGYVEQDAPVLAGSIRDNLTLATPGASDEQCIAVLRSVNLGEVLDRSELGLSAPVGEDGVMLSGGERQRLAIARALLAAPPILLLDESTSSLDGRNEQLMREAIDAVAEDRTLIVIAHRLSTVVDSDQIVVLDHGRVVGVGTHSELVASTPLYRDLAKHQLLV